VPASGVRVRLQRPIRRVAARVAGPGSVRPRPAAGGAPPLRARVRNL